MMPARPVSVQTVISLLVGLASLGGFVIAYQNASRSEAVARSEANDAKLQCNLETIRAEMRCKDTCISEREALLEHLVIPQAARTPKVKS